MNPVLVQREGFYAARLGLAYEAHRQENFRTNNSHLQYLPCTNGQHGRFSIYSAPTEVCWWGRQLNLLSRTHQTFFKIVINVIG